MNILVLSWRGPGHPNAGGAEYVTHEYAKFWVQSGHSVTLFTSYFNGAKTRETIDEVDVIRRGGQDFSVKVQAMLWYLFGKHPRYDIIIDHFHGIPFFTPFYTRIKKIAFIHEVTKNVWKLNPWPKPFNLIPYLIGTVFEPLVFRLLYRTIPFLTVSESTRKDLISFGIPKKNIAVIHNGVDISATPKKMPQKEKRKTVMFLGAISQDKGISDALTAFSLVNQSNKGWQLWIAGKTSPDMSQYLNKAIEQLGIKKNTTYWGFVGNKKKFELLARAHVLINPSVREGWGLVNIEANAVGTPVIGYNVEGMCDSVLHGKTGILCSDKSPDSLANELVNLLKNKKKYTAMREKSRKWSGEFGWDKSKIKSLSLISRLTE